MYSVLKLVLTITVFQQQSRSKYKTKLIQVIGKPDITYYKKFYFFNLLS